MSDVLLERGLDELVPPAEEFGDWDDVLRRAGVQVTSAMRARRRLRRRTIVIVLAVLLFLVAPVVALIAAVATRTNVFFSHAKPAPNVVKKNFADLAVGQPPQYGLRAIATQAREVGKLRVRGKLATLWVAPTRGGGFCFVLYHAVTSCRPGGSRRANPLDVGWAVAMRRGSAPSVSGFEGTISDARAVTIVANYKDGSHDDVPFVYVSAPINAGFFIFTVPKEHLSPDRRLAAVTALDKDGHVLARQPIFVPSHGPALVRPARPSRAVAHPRPLPALSSVPPSPPLQQASANGVSVVTGANGVVVFHASTVSEPTRSLLRGSVDYYCYRLTREFGIFDVKELGASGGFASVAVLREYGLGSPVDGCGISGSYGQRWPDRNGSHDPVEIPLTAAGARYFSDRAAARDLSLFVRSRAVQRIRRESGSELVRDLAHYPVSKLASANAALRPNHIGYLRTATGVTFVEQSPTGRRFTVTVVHGRVAHANVEPYALVF